MIYFDKLLRSLPCFSFCDTFKNEIFRLDSLFFVTFIFATPRVCWKSLNLDSFLNTLYVLDTVYKDFVAYEWVLNFNPIYRYFHVLLMHREQYVFRFFRLCSTKSVLHDKKDKLSVPVILAVNRTVILFWIVSHPSMFYSWSEEFYQELIWKKCLLH